MSNILQTDFVFNNRDGNKVDSLYKKLSDLDKKYGEIGKSANLAPAFENTAQKITATTTKFKAGQDALMKQALADIKKYQLENIAGEKLITKALNTEAKLQSDNKIREIHRADAEAKKSANNFLKNFNNGGGGDSFGSGFGSRLNIPLTSAALGGFAGGAVVTGFSAAANIVSSLADKITDLSIKSVRVAGDFEQTMNALSVFAGSTGAARRELKSLDEIALKTPGLTLVAAEQGYQRLRALNFEAQTSQKLIRGLGIARTQTGADADSIDRVITNLVQLTSGAGTAADARQLVGALPSTRRTFQNAFGTADFGEINRIAKERPDEFIKKFADELNKAQTAQVGLNIALEKGSDAVLQAARDFGEPILQPLTRDVIVLTDVLNKNQNVVKKWGQDFADVYNGISRLTGSGIGGNVISGGRSLLDYVSGGISENAINAGGTVIEGLRKIGEERRKAEERANPSATGSLSGLNESIRREQEAVEKESELIKERKRQIDLRKDYFDTDIQNRLDYSKAVAASNLKGVALIKENTRLETDALRERIAANNTVAAGQTANLLSKDFDAGKGLDISRKNALDNSKLQNQVAVLQINSQKQIADEIKASREIVRDLNAKLNNDNQFVSYFAEAESAVRKLKDTISDPALLQDALKLQQAINLKQFNNLSYQSEKRALSSEQDAFRTSRIRDNELGGFQRALETVDRKVDFAVKMFELGNKINESDFYAYKFNPNNPKTYDQSRFSFAELDRFGESAGNRRRGESIQDYERRRQDAVASGIRVNDAFGEINKLKNLSTGGTGIFGQGIVADKILERLPSREDLLRLLSSPYAGVRDQAQSLLGDQSNALRTKRDLEARKLNDFIYDQQTKGLNQQFAQQNLNLLNQQQFLSPLERAKAKVDILSPLGNDISPQQRRDLYENQLAVAKYERQQKDGAAELINTIKALLAGAGLPVNIKSGTVGFDDASKTALENSVNGSLEIILNDLTANGAKVTGDAGSQNSVKDNYRD